MGGSYRDDREALRVRVQQLEAEVEQLREERGDHEPRSILGGPAVITFSRVVPYEIDEFVLEEMVVRVRTTLGHGAIERLGGALTWVLGHTRITFDVRNGRTKIDVVQNRKPLAMGAIIGSGMLGSFLTLASFGVIHDTGAPGMWLIPAAIVALGGTVTATRLLFGRSGKEQRAKLARLTDELMEIAEGANSKPRIRVAEPQTHEEAVVEQQTVQASDTVK